MGAELAEREPRRGRPRGGPAGQRHARGDRLRRRVGHPLRRGRGAQPLRRPQLHPARPGAAPARHPAQVQPAARGDRAASGWWWWTTRSCAATPPARSWRCCWTPGRRGAHAHLEPADPVAVLLRDRHGRPRRSWSRPTTRSRRSPRLTGAHSLAYLSLEGLQRALGRPASRFCRACFTGEYPIPIPDSSLKLRFEPGSREPARAYRATGARTAWTAGSPIATRASTSTPRGATRRRIAGIGRRRRRPGSPPPTRSPAGMRDADAGQLHRRRRHQAAAGPGAGPHRGPRPGPGGHVRQRPGLHRAPGRWCSSTTSRWESWTRTRRPCWCAPSPRPAPPWAAPSRGGETAEMPGLYAPGHFDLAGLRLRRRRARRDARARTGCARATRSSGIPSSGFHSNGYSLVRALVADGGADARSRRAAGAHPPLRQRHRRAGRGRRGRCTPAAHITGGGLPENLPRALPEGLSAALVTRIVGARRRRTTPCSPSGRVDEDEAWSTFNMGLGMCVVVAPRRRRGRDRRRPGRARGGRRRGGPRRECCVAERRYGWRCWCRAAAPTSRA